MNNIDILEEYLDKQDRKYVSEYRLMILNAIETLIAENKELKEKNKELEEDLEKEKEKNKNAIDFINERKKTVSKDMAEGTRLQVGTFMWQVDELLEILKGVEEE